MSDNLTLLSLFVSLVALAWAVVWPIYLHRHERKEKDRERRERAEEMKEKVEADVSLLLGPEDQAVLEVRVYNPCPFSLPIEAVNLNYWAPREGLPEGFLPVSETNLHLQTILVQPWEVTTGKGRKRAVVEPIVSPSCYLAPRTAATFTLPPELHFKLQEAVGLEPEKVSVSIHTPGGEVGRLDGAQILPFIQVVLHSAAGQQQEVGAEPPGKE